MYFIDQYKNKYNNKLIINLIKEYDIIYNNYITLNEIRILICLLIKHNKIDILKSILDILFEYDVNSILKLLLYYKNKREISKNEFKNIISRENKNKLGQFINFNIKNNNYVYIYKRKVETTTPLHIACYYRYTEIIKLLINYRADINIKNSNNENVLIFMCYYRHIYNVVKLLFEYNIDIHSTDVDGNNPLHILCNAHCDPDEKLFEYLIKKGLNVNKQNNKGNTPLIELCYNVREIKEYILLLIKYGADIDLVNNKGETAFFVACKTVKCQIAPLLFDYGANPYIKDNENNSAIYIFSKYYFTNTSITDSTDLLDFLIEIGFDINETNKDNRSLLMEMSCYNDSCVFNAYVSRGANIYIKDKNGNTALSNAQSLYNYHVENYLIEHGALWKFCNYGKNKK